MLIFCFDNDEESVNVIKTSISKSGINIPLHMGENISSIIKLTENDPCCIIFIETRLHGKRQNSFSIAISLREKLPESHIVFISSYPEDMAFCFKNLVRPSGFLLKPLILTEVTAIINAVNEAYRQKAKPKTFFISTHEFKRKIDISKVVYFSTSGKKLFCRTVTGEKIEFYGTITALSERFSEDFIRCHSGFLVNKLYIKGLKKGELELEGISDTIPVSQKYKNLLMKYI